MGQLAFSDWLAAMGREPGTLGWGPVRWMAERAANDPRWPRGVGYAAVRRHLGGNSATNGVLDALAQASKLHARVHAVYWQSAADELEEYDDA
jgi:hypothetical protein